jgi:hypothetical protein
LSPVFVDPGGLYPCGSIAECSDEQAQSAARWLPADRRNLLGNAVDVPTAEKDLRGRDTDRSAPWRVTSQEFLNEAVISRIDGWEDHKARPRYVMVVLVLVLVLVVVGVVVVVDPAPVVVVEFGLVVVVVVVEPEVVVVVLDEFDVVVLGRVVVDRVEGPVVVVDPVVDVVDELVVAVGEVVVVVDVPVVAPVSP